MAQQHKRTPRGRGVNRRYFQHLLQDQELSQRKLAKLMDMDQSSLVRAFQGSRAFTTHETAKLARILNVPLEDVLANLDVDVTPPVRPKGGTVAVAGQVVSGKVVYGRTEGPRSVAAPPNETGAGLQALRCMDPGPLEGAYLYYRPAVDVEPEAIGRLSICRLTGAGELAAVLSAGNQRGTYTLRSMTGEVIATDAWLDAASLVVWINTVRK